MKTFAKRMLGMLLAAVMILQMIPMNFLSVSAAEDLQIVAEKSTLTIYEEQQLAAQREEDGLARLRDALEEATRHHLESHDGEKQTVEAHAHYSHFNHLRIRGEDACHIFGEELTHHEG